MIGDHTGQCRRQTKLPVRARQQQHAAIRCQASPVEGRGHLLALHRWQPEWQKPIVFHGGCGSLRVGQRLVSTPNSLRYISGLYHIRQRIPAMPVNKTG